MKKNLQTLFLLALSGMVTPAFAGIFTISGSLSGANETPAIVSANTGTISGTYNDMTNVINITVTHSIPAINGAHIHRGAAGVAGGVAYVYPTTAGTTGGTSTLSAADETLLFAGNLYFNVHSSAFPAGEIRAQIGFTPLGVDLVEFKSEIEGENSVLYWTTLSEKNFAGFEVEKSIDGQKFEKISFVKGAGESSTTNKYHFADARFFQTSFYRLKILDTDGSFVYSQVISVVKYQKTRLKIVPNPVAENTVQIIKPDFVSEIIVTNIRGEVVIKINSNQAVENLDISNLSSGIYFVKIPFTEVQKFVRL
jgi:hypothetical protein